MQSGCTELIQINHQRTKLSRLTMISLFAIINDCTLLSSSRTRVWVKLGLFNAKIRNENCLNIHIIKYQLNEQDLLCHSI